MTRRRRGKDRPPPAGETGTEVAGHLVRLEKIKGDATVIFEASPGSPPPVPPGQPVSRHDPFDLEVHRAIVVEPDRDVPPLPRYVPRPHDEVLRDRVRAASAGRSTTAMLVGESSTGKTRAAWEAVQELPEPWTLWHPTDPDRLLGGLDAVAPHTVIWLNDAQNLLLTPGDGLGEKAAAGLRTLVRDPDRGPVLILGTIWPEPWYRLTTPAVTADGSDPHAQARALLRGGDISVPAVFSERDLQALRLFAREDARLAEAAARAADGRVPQFLAGAPALLERYRNAPPPVRALIDAAIDARRLGHGVDLPRALLAHAAAGYLSDAQRDGLPEDWADAAFGHASTPLHGIRGPLSRVSSPADGVETFRLADYLEQTGLGTRHALLPPARLWEAIIDHAEPGELAWVADAARNRGLLELAVRLYARSGGPLWQFKVSNLLRSAGRNEESAAWCLAAARAGIPEARERLTEILMDAADKLGYLGLAAAHDMDYWYGFGFTRDERILRLYEAAGGHAMLDEMLAERHAAQAAAEAESPAPEAGLRSAELDSWPSDVGGDAGAPPGDADREARTPRRWVADRVKAGDDETLDDAERLLVEAGLLTEDDPAAWMSAARAVCATGRRTVALQLFRRAADLGGQKAFEESARLVLLEYGSAAVPEWVRDVAEGGNPYASAAMAGGRARAGRFEEALDWWLAALRGGHPDALPQVAATLRRLGDTTAPSRPADDPGAGEAAEVLWESGRHDEALLLLHERGAAGDLEALRVAADLLAEDERWAEAMALFRQIAESQASEETTRLARLLADRNIPAEALDLIRREGPESKGPLNAAARLLRKSGLVDEADRLERYGWDVDGSIAEPWDASPPAAPARHPE
ncbi:MULTISPECIES: tetratricopeptide repeat protein [unclassified Spirillospora]|uniref:tetratricopeptide repeat protein n=1 Tax=unclassified Spirillospora TaxID=2642701 RepID=UPI00371C0E6B